MKLLQWICSLSVGRALLRSLFRMDRQQPLQLWGINFKHPVGLAAGFDKNARYLRSLETLGFSHVEIGTVTPRPQSGNPKPRLFRLPKDKALINRMGFNNEGVARIVHRLQDWRRSYPESQLVIGGNIGKNKDTSNETAWTDYLNCFEALHPYVDYFTVNVSSPNTPGLRSLQEPEALKKILTTLQAANKRLLPQRPILLKVAPDLEPEAMDEVTDLVLTIGLDGMVLANTTLSREGLRAIGSKIETIGAGGLSGAPLRVRCKNWVERVHKRTNGKLPLIASGGIFTAADAKQSISAGASLIQVWTGFVYEGPGIVKKICQP